MSSVEQSTLMLIQGLLDQAARACLKTIMRRELSHETRSHLAKFLYGLMNQRLTIIQRVERRGFAEFEKVLNILSKGSVFEKAKTLREKQHIVRDNGENLYFEFIQTEHWCQNQFQVTHQIAMEGKYKNRYDVTLLINGLPLVQIELKRRGNVRLYVRAAQQTFNSG